MRMIAHVCIAALLGTGCAHFRVVPEGYSPSTLTETRRVHSIAWGALEPSIVPADCNGNGLAHVTVRVTMLDALAAVATAGFWMPVTVEWTCAKTPGGVRR